MSLMEHAPDERGPIDLQVCLQVDSVAVAPGSPQELVHLRENADRRSGDRRSAPRRGPEVSAVRQTVTFAQISTSAAGLAVAIATWCLVKAPTTIVRTACTDTLGDEVLHHRQLHPAWIASIALCVLAIALPIRPRRSFASVGLVGLALGLGVAALMRVATWRTGACLV